MRFGVASPSSASFLVARKRTLEQLAAAVARAVDTTVANTRFDVSGAMSAAGLGKLANVIRSTSDFRKKRVPPIGDGSGGWRAGGVIFATHGSDRTAGALEAYTQGVTTIIPKRGRWLALATDEIPKRVGRKRMTPELYLAGGFEKRIGKLHFVPSKKHAGEAFLIARHVQVDAARGFGRSLRIPRTGNIRNGRKAVDFIVCFILIKVTTRSRRFDPRAIMARRVAELPTEIRKLLRGSAGRGVSNSIVASSGGSFSQG
jgi:hypothetical protein